jgi:hypothetical protein
MPQSPWALRVRKISFLTRCQGLPSLPMKYELVEIRGVDMIHTQNLGSSLPGTNNLSTLSSVMTAIRITPPDDPSRDIARESARNRTLNKDTFPDRMEAYCFLRSLRFHRVPSPPDMLRHSTHIHMLTLTRRSPKVGGKDLPQEECCKH